MKARVVMSLVGIMVLAHHPAYAQAASAERPPRFGLGVAIIEEGGDIVTMLAPLGGTSASVLLPVSITRGFWLEPEVGLLRVTVRQTESWFDRRDISIFGDLHRFECSA